MRIRVGKNPLYQYLRRCHYTAHFDKQEPVDGEQSYPGTKISSPFGFERDIPDNLTKKLWGFTLGQLDRL